MQPEERRPSNSQVNRLGGVRKIVHKRVAHPEPEQYRRIAGDWRSWIADMDIELGGLQESQNNIYRLDDIKWLVGK